MGLLPDWTNPVGMIQKKIEGDKTKKTADQQLAMDRDMLEEAKRVAAENKAAAQSARSRILGGPEPSTGNGQISFPQGDEGDYSAPTAQYGSSTNPYPGPDGQTDSSPNGTPEYGSSVGGAPVGAGQAKSAVAPGPNESFDDGGYAPTNLLNGWLSKFTNNVNAGLDQVAPDRPRGASESAPESKGYLGEAYDQANQSNDAALAQLRSQLDQIQDPELKAQVENIVSQGATAGADPADMARQREALDKLQGQTDVRETAEEKMLRYMAQQKQEQQQKSDRLAFQNELRGRGVSGSGAETGMFLGSAQARNADRTLSELGANANAQQRAMNALGQYAQGTAVARGQSAQESQFRGSSADKIASLNNTLTEQHNITDARQKSDNNDAATKRAATAFDANKAATTAKTAGAQNLANTDINILGAETGAANQGLQSVSTASDNVAGSLGDKRRVEEAAILKAGLSL